MSHERIVLKQEPIDDTSFMELIHLTGIGESGQRYEQFFVVVNDLVFKRMTTIFASVDRSRAEAAFSRYLKAGVKVRNKAIKRAWKAFV